MYEGLSVNRFFSRVFLNMTWALALTGLAAYGVVSYPPFLRAVAGNMTLLVILIVMEVILVAVLSRWISSLSIGAAYTGFVAYALVNGVTLSLIFLTYTATSIFTVFFISAGLFLLMSLFGFVTKIDLSPIGRFLFMALIGILIAAAVNLFFNSQGLMLLYSVVGVLVFAGLTAYDTQYLKRVFAGTAQTDEVLEKAAIIGALKLYLDFINLFLKLLRIFGKRRR
jgi:FtsH-binding integral membrane protein